jgi:hypothetical protein
VAFDTSVELDSNRRNCEAIGERDDVEPCRCEVAANAFLKGAARAGPNLYDPVVRATEQRCDLGTIA